MRSVLFVTLLLACAGRPVPAPAPATEYAEMERAVVRLVNVHRKERGLRALVSDTSLARIARGHSLDMARREVPFGHAGFDARVHETERVFDFTEIAENVALNNYQRERTVRVAVDGWLSSPHHLQNIEGRFNVTGVGVVRGSNGTFYYTQLFLAYRPVTDRHP